MQKKRWQGMYITDCLPITSPSLPIRLVQERDHFRQLYTDLEMKWRPFQVKISVTCYALLLIHYCRTRLMARMT